MRIAVVTPPPLKPSEPGLSGAAAASRLSRLGAEATWIDASAGWHRFALDARRLAETLDAAHAAPGTREDAYRRAIAAAGREPPALRRAETYADRRVYTSAVNDLENGLRLAALPFPGWRLGVGMVALEKPARRLESSEVLEWTTEAAGPFDGYFVEELMPRLTRGRYDLIAVSLTYQQQAPAAFRLAGLLAERLPGVRRVLGGPLVACWRAAGFALARRPFTLFDEVVAGTDRELAEIAEGSEGISRRAAEDAKRGQGGQDLGQSRRGLPGAHGSQLTAHSSPSPPHVVPWDDAPWEAYLSPEPIVPVASGRGCSWRRCTFCPDYLHPAHAACGTEAMTGWLREAAERFPGGAMLHLTDSALPPAMLAHVAETIRGEGISRGGAEAQRGGTRLPLRWHGFVRVDPVFAEPGFARMLAEGGCAMLQFGVESGSPEVLERLGKGCDAELTRRVLRATAAAGIRNQVYLLFGVPSETEGSARRRWRWWKRRRVRSTR